MSRRKRDSGTTLGKSTIDTLFCQRTNRDKVDRSIRRMQTISKVKDNRPTTRRDPKTDRTPTKSLEKAAIGSLDRSSERGVIGPEKGPIPKNVVRATGVQNRIEREDRRRGNKREMRLKRRQGKLKSRENKRGRELRR